MVDFSTLYGDFYAPGTVHYRRLATDRQLIFDGMRASPGGPAGEAFRFVREAQFSDPTQWRAFVRQFRVKSDTDGGWRGEYWGKTMRGAAFVYSCTRDETLYEIMKTSVEDLLSAAESGPLTTYPPENAFEGWDIWCRKYVMLGLQYFSEICPDAALRARCAAAMEDEARALMREFGPGKRLLTEATHIWRGLAAASVLEPVVRLYDLTGKQEYLDFAGYIVSLGCTDVADLYKIALEGITPPYQFPMTKAYELISCFEGLLEYYRATGEENCRTAVLNFAKQAAENEITLIGSAGCTHELFDHARNRQTDTSCKDVMQETCVTVTWMKFCLQILLLTGKPEWAEAFETSFYNAYLGALNTEKRTDACVSAPKKIPLPFASYAPLTPDVRGRRVGGLCILDDGGYYGCCAAIGGAGIGMTHKAAVTRTPTGVAVNLFFPGEFTVRTPAGQPLKIAFETDYPADGKIKIALSPAAPEIFGVEVRIPSWSENTACALNGTPLPVSPGRYTRVVKKWAAGDTLTLTLDMRAKALRPEKWTRDLVMTRYDWRRHYMSPMVIRAPADAGDFIAIRRGPLVLARDRRLGEDPAAPVKVKTDENGYVRLTPAEAPYPHIAAFRVEETDGPGFLVTDYASAGKTMDEASRCGCWWPTPPRAE